MIVFENGNESKIIVWTVSRSGQPCKDWLGWFCNIFLAPLQKQINSKNWFLLIVGADFVNQINN